MHKKGGAEAHTPSQAASTSDHGCPSRNDGAPADGDATLSLSWGAGEGDLAGAAFPGDWDATSSGDAAASPDDWDAESGGRIRGS